MMVWLDMFIVSIMPLYSGLMFTCYIYIMSSGVYLSHTLQCKLALCDYFYWKCVLSSLDRGLATLLLWVKTKLSFQPIRLTVPPCKLNISHFIYSDLRLCFLNTFALLFPTKTSYRRKLYPEHKKIKQSSNSAGMFLLCLKRG